VNIHEVIAWITIYSEDGDLSLPFCPIDNIGLTAIVDLVKQIDRNTTNAGRLINCIGEELVNTAIRR
jgi:hypothetical protein